jgi:hypothetical protein
VSVWVGVSVGVDVKVKVGVSVLVGVAVGVGILLLLDELLLIKPQSCSHSSIVKKPKPTFGNGRHFASRVSLYTHV